MNLKLEAVNLALWLHFVAVTVGGGAAIVALLLSGFEEGKEDIQGLAATVWAKVVATTTGCSPGSSIRVAHCDSRWSGRAKCAPTW